MVLKACERPWLNTVSIRGSTGSRTVEMSSAPYGGVTLDGLRGRERERGHRVALLEENLMSMLVHASEELRCETAWEGSEDVRSPLCSADHAG